MEKLMESLKIDFYEKEKIEKSGNEFDVLFSVSLEIEGEFNIDFLLLIVFNVEGNEFNID